MKNAQEQLQVYAAGWAAMKWLARHARTQCFACERYHRAVAAGKPASQEVRYRCPLARKHHGEYMAVEKMLLELNDDFECDLIDNSRPELLCSGPARYALVQRSRRGGSLVHFQIGCQAHAQFAEAKAVVNGDAGTFTVEDLETVVREDATKMR